MSSETRPPAPRVLLTGATGYVGRRLLRELRSRDVRIRCLARRPSHLEPWVDDSVEIVGGDAREEEALRQALRGVDVAYYLIHSMGSQGSFAEEDRKAATLFGRVAREEKVGRIVYLGGLGRGPGLSSHLESRQEVGEILRASGVETLEFRASIIIGSGSLSFELIRALVSKLPVMITPRWVQTPTQPIAIEDLLAYLLEGLDVPLSGSAVFEIGGADAATYQDLMLELARQRGMKRWLLPVPFLTPRLSARWLGLVTPVYSRIGKALVEGLRNPTVVESDDALRVFRVKPRTMAKAIERALTNEDEEIAASRWSDALSVRGPRRPIPADALSARIVDSRAVDVEVSAPAAFEPIQRIGGDAGWYFGNPLWRIRGLLDLALGGVGMRRGRAHPQRLYPGDTLDFWRVEAVEPGHLLRLFAEMKVPGRAWLQFEVNPRPEGGSEIRQTAIFDPLGLSGRLYWYALYPIHVWIFRGMLRRIAEQAEAMPTNPTPPRTVRSTG